MKLGNVWASTNSVASHKKQKERRHQHPSQKNDDGLRQNIRQLVLRFDFWKKYFDPGVEHPRMKTFIKGGAVWKDGRQLSDQPIVFE